MNTVGIYILIGAGSLLSALMLSACLRASSMDDDANNRG